MTNTLNKIIHNGDEYEMPGGISNNTEGTTSTVSNIRVGTSTEYGLITPEEGQISLVYAESGGGGWQPGANTLAYYPLTSATTVNDMSGNNRNLTNNNVTFGTSAYFNGSNGSLTTTSLTTETMTTNHTVSLWFNRASGEGGLTTNVPISGWNGYNMYINSNGSTQVEVMSNGGTAFYSNYSTNTGTWHLVTYTHNSSNQVVLYVDGEQKTSGTKGFGTGNAGRLCIGAVWFYDENQKLFYNGYISNFIIENKARTAQEVADYYNQTKSLYGIS